MSTNKSRKYLKILKKRNFFLVIILLIFLVGTSAVLYSQEQGQILRGVTIAGINVGNLTKEEAKKIVDPEVNRLLNQTIKVKVEDQALEVSLKDLGLSLNADLAIQEALDVGREGLNVFSKLFSYKNVNIDFTRVWDELTIKETLNKNLAVFNDPARDASFTITKDNRMLIESEHVGLVIDSEALIKEIKEINIYEPIPEIKAEFIKQIPTITAAQLEEQKITGLLASYTTRFDPNQTARSGNVRIAAKALDMAIIKPGGTISFNQIVRAPAKEPPIATSRATFSLGDHSA
jgi:vancomycin resistance protein YoaR